MYLLYIYGKRRGTIAEENHRINETKKKGKHDTDERNGSNTKHAAKKKTKNKTAVTKNTTFHDI